MTTLGAAHPAPAAGYAPGGRRDRRQRRSLGIVLPATAIAAVVVAAVTVAAYLVSPNGSGAASLAQAIDSLPKSSSIALLEKERQEIIVMNAAARTLTTAAKPAIVSPAQVEASAAAQQQEAAQSQQTVTLAAPDPAAAQATAQQLMPQYGFSVSSQWTCLLDLWTQESSWEYDALNAASGAYGIPQALPGYLMSSVASDWQTDPTTQIEWGLGYIQGRYGTPCVAWDHEVNYGWY